LKTPQVNLEPEKRVEKVITLLKKEYPTAQTALYYSNPLEMLVATILSAQTTDKTVNIVTKKLFEKYRTPEDYANAEIKELEQDIHSTGFYHNKARNLKKCCQILVAKHQSQVPKIIEELIELPGVARKTANIVLFNSYGIISGVAVDTHVRRVSQRLGLTQQNDPVKIEQDLMKITPQKKWMKLTDLLIFHGRQVCISRKPKCGICVLNEICPSSLIYN
jgi:endonuclease III